jgi:homopolymeric O-antigen transport system permease protein
MKDTALGRLAADVREMWQEQIEHRELLYRMTARDLLLRYKQTVMGFGWAICMPVLNMAIFSVIFTRVAPIDTGVPYPIYVYCGLLPWNFLASSLKFSATSLTSNASLVSKVYFPREVFPFSAVLGSLVDFAVGATVLVGLMVYYRIGVGPAILFLPVILVVQVVFTAGVSLVLAMANLFYRDVKYLFEIVLTIWMFTTSVVYPVERVGGWLGQVLRLNPMTPIIDAYRAVVLRGELPAAGPFAAAAALSLLCLAVGWVAFHRAEFQFAENV